MSTMDTNFALDMEREERRAAGCPWRRYFARQFDFALYGLLWSLAAQWGLRLNIGGSYVMLKVLSTVVGAVLMVVIEPFLLHFWGTTPGKWLFGMEIRTPNGEKARHPYRLLPHLAGIHRGHGLGSSHLELVQAVEELSGEHGRRAAVGH